MRRFTAHAAAGFAGPRRTLLAGLLLGATLAPMTAAQNSKLSSVGCMQPSTLLHFGVALAPSAPNLDRCGLFVSIGGVRVFQSMTRQSGPPASTNTTWRLDTRLPATIPPGVMCQARAAAWSSTSPGSFDVSNRIVLTTQPVGPTEKHYAVRMGGAAVVPPTVWQVDIDTGTIVTLPGMPAFQNGVFPGHSRVSLSSDGNRAVMTGPDTTNTNSFQAFVLNDLQSSTPVGVWMAPPSGGYRRMGPARFRPGDSTLVWSLAFKAGLVCTSTSEHSTRWIANDVVTGAEIVTQDLAPHDICPASLQYGGDFTFDSSGTKACFYRVDAPFPGVAKVVIFDVGSAGTVGSGVTRVLSPLYGYYADTFQAVPNGPFVLMHLGGGGDRMVALNTLTSAMSAPWQHPQGHAFRCRNPALDGSYALISDVTSGFGDLYALEGPGLFVAEGAPLSVVGPFVGGFNAEANSVIPAYDGKLLVAGDFGQTARLYSKQSGALPTHELTNVDQGNGKYFMPRFDTPVTSFEENGLFVALPERHAVLSLAREINAFQYYLTIIDVETMTWVGMGTPTASNPDPAEAYMAAFSPDLIF